MPRLLPTAILLAALPLGCSEPDDELTVFAAASMRDAMEDAAATYEASHADVDVRVVLAGSQVLRRQIASGAPASVFVPASFDHVRSTPGADPGASPGANPDEADVAARLEPPAPLACNRPVLVVAPSSPVHRFEDLPDAERIVLGTPEVPIGAYARRILTSAERQYGAAWGRRVQTRVVSRELDVRQVLAKVTLGEADAAIVYRTDAARAGDAVRRVPIPDELNVLARYPIAVVRDGPAHDAAVAFVRWLTSDAGIATLEAHGFERCPTGSHGGS